LCQLGKQNEFHFLCLDDFDSAQIKQALVLLIKLLIVGAAFYFIYNQLANSDALDWEKFIILFKKIGRFRHYFHSAFECLESF
jgi:hypothetical protein